MPVPQFWEETVEVVSLAPQTDCGANRRCACDSDFEGIVLINACGFLCSTFFQYHFFLRQFQRSFLNGDVACFDVDQSTLCSTWSIRCWTYAFETHYKRPPHTSKPDAKTSLSSVNVLVISGGRPCARPAPHRCQPVRLLLASTVVVASCCVVTPPVFPMRD